MDPLRSRFFSSIGRGVSDGAWTDGGSIVRVEGTTSKGLEVVDFGEFSPFAPSGNDARGARGLAPLGANDLRQGWSSIVASRANFAIWVALDTF